MLVKCNHLVKTVLFNIVKLFFCSELKQFLFSKTCKTNNVNVFQVTVKPVLDTTSDERPLVMSDYLQRQRKTTALWWQTFEKKDHLL